jgi:glyoxylase-like metal-dependent hydrolase (beta-lactamase superfamily II)
MAIAYEKGLHELGDGLFAYLEPDGGWGWSNAGLICGEGTSLLVDTLYDLHLTREMLAAMDPVARRHPIDAAINTHANRTIASATSCCRRLRRSTPPRLHVPDADAVFTGDLLFVNGTPIVWASLSNWISACDRILAVGASLLIPGHGPVTDTSGVSDVRRYLRYVQDAARERFQAGMSAQDAADDIDISVFADWGEPERIAANVLAAYRELDPDRPRPTPAELFMEMARWRAAH